MDGGVFFSPSSRRPSLRNNHSKFNRVEVRTLFHHCTLIKRESLESCHKGATPGFFPVPLSLSYDLQGLPELFFYMKKPQGYILVHKLTVILDERDIYDVFSAIPWVCIQLIAECKACPNQIPVVVSR